MVFQDPYSSLNPRQTVGQIIGQPFSIHKTEGDTRALVRELMDRCGMNPEHYNRYPHEFSGGQRQRIGVARALALRPKLIVCDEPVSALDVSIQAQILNLLESLQGEFDLTYVFISHDLSVIRQISDRIAVMYLGRIVELADWRRSTTLPRHPYTAACSRPCRASTRAGGAPAAHRAERRRALAGRAALGLRVPPALPQGAPADGWPRRARGLPRGSAAARRQANGSAVTPRPAGTRSLVDELRSVAALIRGELVDLRPFRPPTSSAPSSSPTTRLQRAVRHLRARGGGHVRRRFELDGYLSHDHGRLVVVDKAARRWAASPTSRSFTARRPPTASTTSASTSTRRTPPRLRRRRPALLARYLFETYTIERVEASTDVENIPAATRSSAPASRARASCARPVARRRLARRLPLQQAARRVGLSSPCRRTARGRAGSRSCAAEPVSRSILSGGTCSVPVRETLTESRQRERRGLSYGSLRPDQRLQPARGGVTCGGTALSATQPCSRGRRARPITCAAPPPLRTRTRLIVTGRRVGRCGTRSR